MNFYKGFVTALAVCVLCLFSMSPAFSAEGTPTRISLLATDEIAHASIVKFGDEKPRLWRVGEILKAGNKRFRLRQCAAGHVVVDVIDTVGSDSPQVLLIAVSENYQTGASHLMPGWISSHGNHAHTQ